MIRGAAAAVLWTSMMRFICPLRAIDSLRIARMRMRLLRFAHPKSPVKDPPTLSKFRFATSAALSIALALPAFAQTAPAPATAPAPVQPAPATPPAAAAAPVVDIAERNAITNTALPAAEAAMKAHVMFLASDAMKGRDAGSPEYDIAAQYVASQFYSAGLRPMGDDGSYLQKVPLITVKAKDQGSFAYQPARGPAIPMTLGRDYVPGTTPAKAVTSVDAGLVFVGFGIVEPGIKRDDYAGVDVRGKIVLLFGGAPESLHPELRAHFGNAQTKRAIAAAKGAAGVIVIESNASAKAGGFAQAARFYQNPRVTWSRGDVGFDPAPAAPALGSISQAFAQTLFAGSRLPWADVVKGAESAETRFKATALPGRIAATINTEWTPLPSSNVVGLLPGSDPQLKNEYVVLSAHLDHVGVGRPVNGDPIYNGAMDNAVGIASLIEEAKKFKASGTPTKRSILFVAVTAEEKGLVGSEYFAHNPTVPKAAMVANVNLDMPIITYKFEDVIAFGADRSTL
ncbi:MAG: M28 family peptidase, partial [Sphingomonadales bacterium]|nr:M28 family peptidase [Sphingomonadales bacterium]